MKNFRSPFILSALAMLLAGCNGGNGLGGGSSTTSANLPEPGTLVYTVQGGAQLTVGSSSGLLTGGHPNGATVVAVSTVTPLGGKVTANNDGSFTYSAPAGITNQTDEIAYVWENNAGQANGRAQVQLSGLGIFVNNQAVALGDGSQALPFQNLGLAQNLANGKTGAEIIVFAGDGTSRNYGSGLNLGNGQVLRGFSSTSIPTLTGPINLTTNNRLQNLRFAGSIATPINATNSSGGNITGVTVVNSSNGVSLNNATGTWLIGACNFTNITGTAISAQSSTGALAWSVSSSSFANVTSFGIEQEPTATASQNLTVSGCSFAGGTGIAVESTCNTTGSSIGLSVLNCSVSGQNTANQGVGILVEGNTTFTGLLNVNNVTGCTTGGLVVAATGNSTAKVKFDSNNVLGNAVNLGLVAACNQNSTLCTVISSNRSDAYVLNQTAPAIFNCEQLATVGTRNVGTSIPSGAINDVVAGACGLP